MTSAVAFLSSQPFLSKTEYTSVALQAITKLIAKAATGGSSKAKPAVTKGSITQRNSSHSTSKITKALLLYVFM